ncbi:MAG TPA: UDP-N-acetylmuramate--L-alanine ligase [Acidimicrobiales bacterium]|nr:UDP-N-acetylmuramate--L-alanine ligase [Acidimicrobiales bacterium]
MGDGLDLSRPGLAVHVVGVGGTGMSAIAEVLVGMGHRVSGSDLRGSPVLSRLAGLGVDVAVGHDAANVPAAVDLVARSSAIAATNPEVAAAQRRGVAVVARADVLAAITRLRRTIAIAGTHGKTTTSALVAAALDAAGLDPSFVVGGEIAGLGTGGRWSAGEWLVVEADESDGTFLDLEVEVGVVTSVEPDHVEHYGDFDAEVAAFARFLAGAGSARLVCADDPVAASLGAVAGAGAATYGFHADAGVRIVDYEGGRGRSRFRLATGGHELGVVDLALPGRHNARNAAGAVAAALAAGAPADAALAGVATFQGVGRRSQLRGERDGITFVDDYAHLPGEVAPALAAAVEGGWDRVVCVFQPHRYSRTEALWADFAHAFAGADLLVVTELYPAGEAPRPGVSGRLVADAVRAAHPERRVEWRADRADLVAFLRHELRPGDLCLTLGAGDLTTVPDELLR